MPDTVLSFLNSLTHLIFLSKSTKLLLLPAEETQFLRLPITCLPTAYKVLSLSALTSADTETESLYKA